MPDEISQAPGAAQYSKGRSINRPYFHVKRLMDIALALLLIVPAGIIVLLCALAVRLETKGPAFYARQRPGYKGKLFTVYKLRSMIVETHRDGRPLKDMERITKTGKIIRAFSFDELPQLLNILKGEMSFIGPRPLLPEYLPLYNAEQSRRHDVLPGLSGWAQVNGRNEITWEQKFERDVWYVDHMSFLLDMKIFWMTIVNVTKREGINSGVDDTMGDFTGTKEPS